MKRCRLLRALVGALLSLHASLLAAESEFWYPYDLGTEAVAVPSPNGTNTLSGFLPENDGGYVAIWDDGDGAIAERRNRAGQQLWSWRPPEPRPDSQEVTRAVMISRSHLLWCSAQRWFYLALTNGSIARSNDWSLPYLDANKLVPQNDLLYVIYGDQASVYDTNMERQATVALTWPAGYWRPYAGNWLLDLSTRTNRTLRVASLGSGLTVSGVHELGLSEGRAGGHVEHRVLGASTDRILVISSLSWPDRTRHFFSCLTSAGALSFQHVLEANQMITGAAVLEDGGWLLSAQYLGELEPRHTLFRVDEQGRPHWQVRVASAAAQQIVVLNTVPPRVLRFSNGVPWELRSVRSRLWFDVLDRIILPDLSWDGDSVSVSGIVGDTNYYWMEPVRPNSI
jgi:hypothetical protein